MSEIIDLLTADQLARKLNITVSWIYSHARNKGDNSIPHLKIGKYIRFSESDVRLWLHSKQKNTIACE
jgi:excisionase family DNA binding protein